MKLLFHCHYLPYLALDFGFKIVVLVTVTSEDVCWNIRNVKPSLFLTLTFSDGFMSTYLLKNKRDVCRVGAHVLLAKINSVSCILFRYVRAANLDLSFSLPFFSLFA